MRILFIAPQPYYEERGTLIAVDLLLRALAERGDEVDLLTYHLGEDRRMPGIEVFRIAPRPAPSEVRPGPSLPKLWCDVFLSVKALRMGRSGRYDLVYAVEEGAFIALAMKWLYGLPFVFDMDSSMADQIIERYPAATPVAGALHWLESQPMRRAAAVIPMCDAIADRVRPRAAGFVETLKDVSLVDPRDGEHGNEDLRRDLHLHGPVAMYIGNLQPYQGIDLLLEAFTLTLRKAPDAALVIIGGSDTDLAAYRRKVRQMELGERVHLLGPRPVSQLGYFMRQADVLVSPRTRGINTPMKVYSYLDSGVPVVATNLPTHTQVMTDEVAKLAEPDAESFSAAMSALFGDPEERRRLAANAKELVRREHSEEAFRRQVHRIFDRLQQNLGIAAAQ